MLRALVLLLALANLGFYAWTQGWLDNVVGVRADSQREPERLARQANRETVQILSPVATAGGAVLPVAALPVAATATPAASAVAGACLEAGPFGASEVEAAAAAVQAALPAGRWADLKTDKPGSWLIYMGRYGDPELLAKKREEITRMKLPFEEVRNLPSLTPGLSLGRFDDRANAERTLAQFALRGVKSARIVELTPVVTTHVLRVDAADAALVRQLGELKSDALGRGFVACAKVAVN